MTFGLIHKQIYFWLMQFDKLFSRPLETKYSFVFIFPCKNTKYIFKQTKL